MLYIPKIQYGDVLPMVVQFEYPELGYGQREQADPDDKEVISISGKTQVQTNFMLLTKAVTFGHLDEEKVDALRNFFYACAGLGRSFRYYEDALSDEYVTYELKDRKFQPKRTNPAGENRFWYQVSFTFKRVDEDTEVETMELDILNAQAAPVELGFRLSSVDYQSVKLFAEIRRSTLDAELVANGYLTANYRTNTNQWDITPSGSFDGDEHGVTFSVDPDGEVQYASSALAGANYVGKIKLKSLTF